MTGPAGNGRPGSGEAPTGARPHFGDRLANAVEARRSQIVLGIDPDPMKLWPAAVEDSSEARARLAATLSEAEGAAGEGRGAPPRGGAPGGVAPPEAAAPRPAPWLAL